MTHRGRTLLAGELVARETVESESLDEGMVAAGRHGVAHGLAAHRRCLESPGSPTGVEVEASIGVTPMMGAKSGVMSASPAHCRFTFASERKGNISSTCALNPSAKSSVERVLCNS